MMRLPTFADTPLSRTDYVLDFLESERRDENRPRRAIRCGQRMTVFRCMGGRSEIDDAAGSADRLCVGTAWSRCRRKREIRSRCSS
jgi:hypothetical protein